MVERGAVAKQVKFILESQEIQKWHCDISSSPSLSLYASIKDLYGEEVYFKAGLSRKELKCVISVRGNFVAFGDRRKYLGKIRSKAGPYFCPICGDENDD